MSYPGIKNIALDGGGQRGGQGVAIVQVGIAEALPGCPAQLTVRVAQLRLNGALRYGAATQGCLEFEVGIDQHFMDVAGALKDLFDLTKNFFHLGAADVGLFAKKIVQPVTVDG